MPLDIALQAIMTGFEAAASTLGGYRIAKPNKSFKMLGFASHNFVNVSQPSLRNLLYLRLRFIAVPKMPTPIKANAEVGSGIVT
jgi:hypothetical protein